MAVSFADTKDFILLVLYDYMLTSDDESFYFSISAIREGLPVQISGAFVRRALDSLIIDKDVEVGSSDGNLRDIYALTDQGIESAESIIEEKGGELAAYAPSPEVDRIISQFQDTVLHKQISEGLSKVASEIRNSNKISVDLGEAKDVILSEAEAAASLSAKSRFRVTRLAALIVPTLRYLSDRFVGQGIGELAKQLADLLMKAH